MENRVLHRRSMRHMQDRRYDRRDMRGMRDKRYDYRDMRRSNVPAGGMYGYGMGKGAYYPESSGGDYRGYDRYYGTPDFYFGGEQYRQPDRIYDNEAYMHDPMMKDYRDYRDYGDYNHEKEEYRKDLHEWIERMKRNDRFGWSKEQVIQSAKQMGVKFENYDEDEFYAIYLAMVTDYKSLGNEPRIYLTLAKEWLHDDDVALKGGEKVCAYLYDIVLDKD